MNLTIEEVNKKHQEIDPENNLIEYWSGCNYYVNQGNNEYEPKGSATSMHECDGCERITYCPSKKKTPVWEHSQAIEFEMILKWNEMIENRKQNSQ